MNIYKKLALIQAELFVPKGQKNDFGKYNYRSCEDILKTVKPLCDKNGCVLYISNDLEVLSDRIYVKAEVKLIDIESGESITSVAHAREEETKKGMDGSQITGASSSYARKYALAGLFCIDNEKDSDATNLGNNEPKQTMSAVDAANYKTKVLAYINRHNLGVDKIKDICKFYKIEVIGNLTGEMALDYIKRLTEKGGNIDE